MIAGADTPMSVLYVDDPASSCMLVMEILDVKQVPWPEPSKKVLHPPDACVPLLNP